MSGETQQVRAHHEGHGHEGPGRRPGALGRLRHRVEHVVKPHSHEAADKVDAAMESSREGMRALWISLGVLGVTALAQAVVVVWSGSVALLGDTLHNAADALTAVPLGIAFTLGRRAPTRRYCRVPAGFLEASGFQVVRDHPRYPLMRMDLRTALTWKDAREAAREALRVPSPGQPALRPVPSSRPPA